MEIKNEIIDELDKMIKYQFADISGYESYEINITINRN